MSTHHNHKSITQALITRKVRTFCKHVQINILCILTTC